MSAMGTLFLELNEAMIQTSQRLGEAADTQDPEVMENTAQVAIELLQIVVDTFSYVRGDKVGA